jgi:hypothetical protein
MSRRRRRRQPAIVALPTHALADDLVWREDDFRQVFPIPSRHVGIGAYEHALRSDPCAYCGLPSRECGDQEIDHIHSRWTGGPDHWSNYTAACPLCNRVIKSDMVLAPLSALQDLRAAKRLADVRVEVVR